MATKTPPKVKTSFTNTKGEKVTVFTDGTKTRIPAAPKVDTTVVNNGRIDLSKVTEDVKPLGAPSTDLRDLSVAFSGKASESQLQDIATRNPELASRVGSSVSSTVPDTFVDTTPEEPEDVLARTAETIASEIRTIEEKMAGREGERTDQLEELGVFEDMRTLNDLKAELRAAEDRDIEIPIEGRQKLRGQQATRTEYNQETRPQLENNLLRSLAASRNVSRMTDTINTNIAIVDQKIKADTERDEFLYKQKQDRLTKVETAYGNIITEKQKVALEEKKFEYSLLLEDVKTNNTLRADLIKEIAKKGVGGVQLQGLMDATIDELVSFQYESISPKNWSEMTYEEASMVLDKDSFDKYKVYKEWEKTATEEEKAAGDQLLAVTQTADGTIKLIEDLLNDEQGMKTSVGVGPLGARDFNFFGAGTESTKFRSKAKQLMSQATLDKLLELKAAGGTLGAISEKELDILGNAATALGAIYDDNGKATGRFKFQEADFEEALEVMRGASMKTFIAANIGKDSYGKAGYQFLDVTNEEDFKIIEDRYNDIKANGVGTRTNYADEELKNPVNLDAAFETIRQEEGLRTEAYQDTTGTWTIGFGNTQINGRPVKAGDKLTTAQAETLMQQSVIQNYTSFTDKVAKQITPNQFAALTSFEYNLGPGVWNTPTGSQILSLVNSGDYSRAGQLMLQYNKARDPQTGQLITNRVLAQRRAREANLLLA